MLFFPCFISPFFFDILFHHSGHPVGGPGCPCWPWPRRPPGPGPSHRQHRTSASSSYLASAWIQRWGENNFLMTSTAICIVLHFVIMIFIDIYILIVWESFSGNTCFFFHLSFITIIVIVLCPICTVEPLIANLTGKLLLMLMASKNQKHLESKVQVAGAGEVLQAHQSARNIIRLPRFTLCRMILWPNLIAESWPLLHLRISLDC